jgi:hypothetical protein
LDYDDILTDASYEVAKNVVAANPGTFQISLSAIWRLLVPAIEGLIAACEMDAPTMQRFAIMYPGKAMMRFKPYAEARVRPTVESQYSRWERFWNHGRINREVDRQADALAAAAVEAAANGDTEKIKALFEAVKGRKAKGIL